MFKKTHKVELGVPIDTLRPCNLTQQSKHCTEIDSSPHPSVSFVQKKNKIKKIIPKRETQKMEDLTNSPEIHKNYNRCIKYFAKIK